MFALRRAAALRSLQSPLKHVKPSSVGIVNQRPFHYNTVLQTKAQSASPLAPIGVEAALRAASDPTFKPRPTIQKEFDLTGRVAVVSGGNRGLGLEMAEALCEAGASVYCLDLPDVPGEDWQATQKYVSRLGIETARLEYRSVDVTDQKGVWSVVEEIANKEKRMDACIAAAGILGETIDCLNYGHKEFSEVVNVDVNGALYTAQAVARQMVKFGRPGSITLIASMSGSITNKASRLGLSKSEELLTQSCWIGRDIIGLRTILASLPYFRWAEVLRASWASTESG